MFFVDRRDGLAQPGFLTACLNLRQVAEFTKTLRNVEKLSLLPCNGAAGAKYSFVGRKYGLEGLDEYTSKRRRIS